MVNSGTTTMTNSDFLAEVYGDLQPGEYGWVTTFRANPNDCSPEVWSGRIYAGRPAQAVLIDRALEDNTYFCTAVLKPTEDGEIYRRKETFARLAVLVVDDVQLHDVQGFSYAIQTSPGKFQVGIFLDAADPDCADRALIDKVMQSMATRGRSNDRSGNACVRYVRLPYGSNTKPRAAGVWQTRMEVWQPTVRWTLEDACAAVGIDLDQIKAAQHIPDVREKSGALHTGNHAGEMVTALTGPVSERAYHDSIVRLAASLIAGGMFPGAAVEFMYSLMDQAKPTGPLEEVQRWQARRNEIPRAVKSAEKFAPEERKPPQITVNLNLGKNEQGEADTSGLLVDLRELERKSGQVSWQVKHMVPADSMGMIFGASGTFKSFIALDHGLHVAHGLSWMGRKTKQGGVVYVAAEGGAGIYRRVAAWHQQHKLALAQNFHVCITPMVLSLSEHVDALASAIEALPYTPSLIYIDTLSQTFDGDENSNSDIAMYLRTINACIRARFHATVVVIHHSGHAATERPRGASAITANVDFMLGVYRPDAERLAARVDVMKQKDGDRHSGQGFDLARCVLGHDEDGDEVSSLCATWSDLTGKLMAAQNVRLAGHEQVVMQMVEESGGSLLDNDLRHAFYNHLGAQAQRGGKEFNQASARQAYLRTLKGLADKGLLALKANGFVTQQHQGIQDA
jgi:hypothetical protein